MSDTEKPIDITRKPRIVAPPDPDAGAEAAGDLAKYEYFAMQPPERIAALKKKIEGQEQTLFDIETGIVMLEGNPHTRTPHRTDVPEGQACYCGNCELDRLLEMQASSRYALEKLRALYKSM